MDATVTEYLHDGDHEIVELDGSGAVLRRYVHGPGTDRPIAMVEGGPGSYTHSYYHADRLGSVVALTNDSGAPVAHYAYSEYGVPYLVDPGTGAQTQVAAGQPFLFTGRRFDFETGLYYYRARYYSASLGRFLQTDPIGYDDQMNLYAYVGNDPVNAWDPNGLCRTNRETQTVDDCKINYADNITEEQKKAFEKQLYEIGVAIEDASYDPHDFESSWYDIGEINVSNTEGPKAGDSEAAAEYRRGEVDKKERGIINVYRLVVTMLDLSADPKIGSIMEQHFDYTLLNEIEHGTPGGRVAYGELQLLKLSTPFGNAEALKKLQRAETRFESENAQRAVEHGKRIGLLDPDYTPLR